ncbi:MAG: hypothetical protein ACKOEL_03130 [Planctomycetota bacterium]
MRTFALRTDLERHRVGDFQLPLGLEPLGLPAPQEGYTVEFVESDEHAPDTFRFYAVTSFERVAPLLEDLFELLPDEVFPLVEAGSKDAFRTTDVFTAREPLAFDDFMDDWRSYRDVILEDGSIGAGAQADEPYMEVFVDSWKGIEVQVPPDLREEVERVLGRHGLEEVVATWPPELDERPEPPLAVREILVLDDEQCPDLDEVLFQLRESWGLELDVDPDDNLDEAGRYLGRTLWHVVGVVESADEDHPRAGYAMAWLTAGSLGEVQRMVESRIELQDEWRFEGQWYSADRVAYDERPDSLQSLAPRRGRSELHDFRIEPA